jgi:hypothetical protein
MELLRNPGTPLPHCAALHTGYRLSAPSRRDFRTAAGMHLLILLLFAGTTGKDFALQHQLDDSGSANFQ